MQSKKHKIGQQQKDNDELKETTSSKLGDFFEKDLPKIENYIADNWQKELNP